MAKKEKKEKKEQTLPPQQQDRQPGIEAGMKPRPKAEDREYRGSGKLEGKVALITGGDSGIEPLERTLRTKIFSHFFITKAALPHLKEGSAIIHTTSVTAYRGSQHLMDYASTKAAIVGFLRSLSTNLASRKIRVNGVAPGPVWTPLIPASFPAEKVESFGSDVPLGRPGQPEEVAPCFVFLASEESSYMTGQVLHPNGGEVVNG